MVYPEDTVIPHTCFFNGDRYIMIYMIYVFHDCSIQCAPHNCQRYGDSLISFSSQELKKVREKPGMAASEAAGFGGQVGIATRKLTSRVKPPPCRH